MVDKEWDYAIVGAGSAGATLAARLSEDSRAHVILIEAGRDFAPGQEPADIRDVFYTAAYNWDYHWPNLRVRSIPQDRGGKEGLYTQARVMGGNSSINSMVAQRGQPRDFQRWVEMGASGWDWEDVLPYYIKLENDSDFDGPMHGKDGPITIRRHPKADWPQFSKALERAMQARGLAYVADMIADIEAAGYCSLAMTSTPQCRASTAISYLTAEVRRRPNLTILSDATAEKLLFADKRVRGLRLIHDGSVRDLSAREVILSAGTLHSPALLMRSGVGEADHLKSFGIPVVEARSGVGRNLHDHASITVAGHIRRQAKQPEWLRSHANLCMRFSSALEGCDENDMYISMMNKTSWHPLGKRLASMVVVLNQPFSRGELRLRGPSALEEPSCDLNVLQDERDAIRLAQGMKLAADLLSDPEVSPFVTERFAAIYSERVAKLSRIGAKAWVSSLIGSIAMDGPPAVRRFITRRIIAPDADLEPLLNDTVARAEWLKGHAGGFFHSAGSCRMGCRDDPGAVVDPSTRVIGVEGVRVVDASIMPQVVKATPNVTVIMMAEKVAAEIRAQAN